MKASDIYERRIFKNKFKDLYNQDNYNFAINNNLLNNIITKWRNNSNRFTKISVFDNAYDYSL